MTKREESEDRVEDVEAFADALAVQNDIVVLTGAGISTLSGIPDFRGNGGAYAKPFKGLAVEEILSIGFFHAHPDVFYDWCKDVWYDLDSYSPNIVHRVLAKMERMGKIRGVYTQNIDMLHQRAGSRLVFELHGSPAQSECVECSAKASYDEVAPVVRSGHVPKCPKCGGILKPRIVLYGEGLDGAMLDRAFTDFAEARMCLVLGTSLVVSPASSLPAISLRNGRKLAIVNKSRTHLDGSAILRLTDLEKAFTALDERLGE